MRTFTVATAIAAVGLFCPNRADAQVIGTRGTSSASLGYYSPVPGTLYSPFRAPPPTYFPRNFVAPGASFAPRYVPRTIVVTPGFSANTFYGTRFSTPKTYVERRYGSPYGYGRPYRR